MGYNSEKFTEFVTLLEKHTPSDGIHFTSINGFGLIRASEPLRKNPTVYEPLILITGQGEKHCYLNGQKYDYSAGKILTLFLTMPIESDIIGVSPEKPFLCAGIKLDLARLANLVLKLDNLDQTMTKPGSVNTSGIFAAPLRDNLLDPTVRLLRCLDSPQDAAILGESIIEEIYYRLLCDEQGRMLRHLLQQRGHVQRISKAVEYIHQNIEEPVSVEKLAGLVNMSSSNFHKNFKDVMHLSPLQYAKSMKLFKAQTLIQEGKNASEAGYLVGYNSPAQFSREYKRHFGFAPSAT